MGDVAELGFDLGLRKGGVGGQVDEVLFLGVECLQLGGQLLLEEPIGGLLSVDGFGDLVADAGDEVAAESDRRVVRLDGVFDECDVDVGRVAGALLFVAAEEVEVFVAVSVGCSLDDHPPDGSGPLAASAEQGSFEVVVVDSSAFVGVGAGFEDLLDVVEEVLVDQRLVSALHLLALVDDVAEVVAVAQHLRELVSGNPLGGTAMARPGAQPAVVEFLG
ncbi:hypothetical protein OHB21_13010 [Nocardia puris]